MHTNQPISQIKIKRPTKSFIGIRVGKLLVIDNVEPNLGALNDGGLWKCQCDCGKTTVKKGYNLRDRTGNGMISCGCSTKEGIALGGLTRRKYKESTIHAQYCTHRRGSADRDLQCLSKDKWLKIVFEKCAYCGDIDTRNLATEKRRNISPDMAKLYEVDMNGIDRIDSDKGYEEGNCVPCCAMCNKMKNTYEIDIFLGKIDQIHDYMKNRI